MQVENIEVREARPGDERLLVDLFDLLDRETEFMLFEPGERPASVERQAELIEAFSESRRHLLLIAIEQDQIVGFLGATGGQASRVRHVADFAMGVVRAYWGKGVGKLLLSGLEGWAVEHGYHRIEMTVMESNERAQKLYLSKGYEVEGVRRCSMKSGGTFVNEVYMSKLLSIG